MALRRVMRCSSSAAEEVAFRKLTAVGQQLKVRALAVDAQIFRRTSPKGSEPKDLRVSARLDTATLATKDMLTKQVRHELKKRGLDAIGKPWTVRERLDEARELEDISRLQGTPEVPQQKLTPQVPQQTDVRAKYAAKLRGKLDAPPPDKDGDAALLQAARQVATTPSRWRLGPPGLRTLLDFAVARSMSLVLVARADTTDQELEELLRQSTRFDLVHREGDLVAACAKLDVAHHQTLAFFDDRGSENDDVSRIGDAKRAGILTCLLRDAAVTASTGRARPDFHVDTCADVINIINDLNGISYRTNVPVYSS